MIPVNLAHESIFVYCTFNSVNLVPSYHSVIQRAVFPLPPIPRGGFNFWFARFPLVNKDPETFAPFQSQVLSLVVSIISVSNWFFKSLFAVFFLNCIFCFCIARHKSALALFDYLVQYTQCYLQYNPTLHSSPHYAMLRRSKYKKVNLFLFTYFIRLGRAAWVENHRAY